MKKRCDDTNGLVSYTPPSLYEATRNAIRRRRWKMERMLEGVTDEVRRAQESARRQNDWRFKSAEMSLKRRCSATIGKRKVKYTEPSPTESKAEKDTRRTKMRRQLERYHLHRARSYAASYSKAFCDLVRRDMISESKRVSCPLGDEKCPCRGVKWNHHCYVGDMDVDDYLDECELYWDKCHVCGNDYDKRTAKSIDLLLMMCKAVIDTIGKKKDDDDITRIGISPATIEESLTPRVLVILKNTGDDDEETQYEKVRCQVEKWMKEEYAYNPGKRDDAIEKYIAGSLPAPEIEVNLKDYGVGGSSEKDVEEKTLEEKSMWMVWNKK